MRIEAGRDPFLPGKGSRLLDISLEIHCEACGSANYSLAEGHGDEAPILCLDCGADQGRLGALKAELIALALDQSAESLRLDVERLHGRAGD